MFSEAQFLFLSLRDALNYIHDMSFLPQRVVGKAGTKRSVGKKKKKNGQWHGLASLPITLRQRHIYACGAVMSCGEQKDWAWKTSSSPHHTVPLCDLGQVTPALLWSSMPSTAK